MRQHLMTRLMPGLVAAMLLIAAPVSAAAEWTTYHFDQARTGLDPNAPPFANSVNQQWTHSGLDQNVYAEPLVFNNMVLVATEANSVYALNPDTGAVLWTKNYGTSVPSNQLPCGNINPVGITGTPVIDTATGTLYAVGLMWDGSTKASIHYQLEAINVNNSGQELWNQVIAPTDATYVFDPLIEGQRSGLSLASGNVYIPFGGRAGDCSNPNTGVDYRGWVVGAPAAAPGTLLSFPLPTGANNGAGGIWATSGAAVDGSNNLYVATGNTRCGGGCALDYGESVIKLSPTLTILDYFRPPNWAQLNIDDQDLGSVGPTLLPNGLLFQIGKEGVGYLLRTSNLGGANHTTAAFSARVCTATSNAAFGGVAYSAPYLYVPCANRLEALLISTGASPSFSSAWHGPAGSIGPPIVAGGLVWSINYFARTIFGLYLGTGEQRIAATLPATPMHFATPATGNGKLFVADASQVVAYGTACGSASTRQYSLTNSDGVTWTDMDPANLQQTLAPTTTQWALLEANADLWTATGGVNQDLGIFVSTDGGADTLAGWKESGGYGGTLSPNAAFLQVPFQVTAGSIYVVKLKWKANKDVRSTGAQIRAGAGAAGPYSPTSLSARLIPNANLSTAVSQAQESIVNSDGATWQPLGGPGTVVSFSPSANQTAILGGNADLWTADAGYNQDLGIFVSVNAGADTLVGWKESGGFAGTYSPNAAFVHSVYGMTAGANYTFKLKWKANRNDSAPNGIYAGAGPINGAYSPTRLTAEVLAAGTNPQSAAITTQPSLSNSDGVTWQPVSAALDQSITPTASSIVTLEANADLWTASAGYNQDIGIFVSIASGPRILVAWKESGGFNGVFSPNAAFVQSQFLMGANTNYRFSLMWKTNRNASGKTIYMGAGPVNGAFSPTRLTAEMVTC